MFFILGLVALICCFLCWHFFWSDTAFRPYLTTLNPKYGPKGIVIFWVSVVFGIWGLLINQPAPSSLSLLISAITAALWLSTVAGQKFLKDLV